MGKATLTFYIKEEVSRFYLMEIKVYSVTSDLRFTDGVKYSLIFLHKETGDKVLFDNHHPKGHHYHLGNSELNYSFKNVETLVADFKRTVFQYFGVKL